jgi:hypothetical protein
MSQFFSSSVPGKRWNITLTTTRLFRPKSFANYYFEHGISPAISNNSSAVVNIVTYENTNIFADCFRSIQY